MMTNFLKELIDHRVCIEKEHNYMLKYLAEYRYWQEVVGTIVE